MSPPESGPAARPRAAASPRARFWLRLSIAALSFAVLIGSGLAWAAYKNFTTDIPHGAPVPPLAAGGHDPDGADQNILLVGNDSRAGASKAELKALHDGGGGGGVNTDTMIVLHVPASGAAPTLVSIPRDSWVRIPGYGKAKINAAYGDAYTTAKDHHRSEQAAQSAGMIETIKTIEALTGLHIDHYAQVNLLGFYRISNAIGGVTVCLKSAQNATTDADAYGHGYSGIDLPKGVSVIKGKQALAFVRQRHGLPHGDLDRIKRQQYFLASALHKVTSAGVLLNPFKLHDLLDAVGHSLLTDPSLDLLDLARQMQSVAQGTIKYLTVPNNGPQLIYPDGVETSIVAIDKVAMPGFIRELQGQPDDPALATAKPAARSAVSVDVLNGTQVVGLAGRNAAQLRKLGVHVETVDSTDAPVKVTQLLYPAGAQAAAKAVLALVPGAHTLLTSSVKHVTLELGSDGQQVRGLGKTTRDKTAGGASSDGASSDGANRSAATKAPKRSPLAEATNGLGCIN